MMHNELLYRQTELEAALSTLRYLKDSPSNYRNSDPDDLLMQTSISETSDAVIEMFQTLQAIDDAFQKLLEHTILSMEYAGVSFDQADRSSAKTFNDLPYTPQYGR